MPPHPVAPDPTIQPRRERILRAAVVSNCGGGAEWARDHVLRLLVQEYVAGAVDFSGEIVGATMVGVQFDHQPTVRLLDSFGIRAGRETEDRVGFLDTHVPACRARPRAVPAAAGTFSGELVAPLRVNTVE